MLLPELFLFEAMNLNEPTSFIHVPSGRVIPTPTRGTYHLKLIADNPEMFGVDPNEIQREISQYQDVDEWMDDADNLFSQYHVTAYNNGWVRWRMYDGDLNISGVKQYLQPFLRSRDMINYIKSELEEDPTPLPIFIDYLDDYHIEKYGSVQVGNLVDYTKFLRDQGF